MAPSYDTVADVPSLLEAMVGWLDADDHLEPATFRRRHGPTAVGECPAPTAGARLRTWFLPSLRARMASCPRRAMGAPPDQPMVGRPDPAQDLENRRQASVVAGDGPASTEGIRPRAGFAPPPAQVGFWPSRVRSRLLVDTPVASPAPTGASTGG